MITKAELVELDERFIEWLNSKAGLQGYEDNKDKRFLTVATDGDYIDISGYDSIGELKEAEENAMEDPTGWSLKAIFDVKYKKNLAFYEKMVIEVEGVDFGTPGMNTPF